MVCVCVFIFTTWLVGGRPRAVIDIITVVVLKNSLGDATMVLRLGGVKSRVWGVRQGVKKLRFWGAP